MKKEKLTRECRCIRNTFMSNLIETGKLDNLFEYLKKDKDKYNLTVRNDKFTLYSFGRGLDIDKSRKNLVMSFNINNADLLLKFDKDKLDSIMETLHKDYGVDRDKYDDWAAKRYEYVMKTKDEKILYNLEHQKSPGYTIKIYIPENDVANFTFQAFLDTIFPIFESYSTLRPEEKFRQECMGYYSTFTKDLVVYDVEYKVNFEKGTKASELDLCQENGAGIKQFFKPDLVALKREGNKYIPLFIELKVKCGASAGDKANIGDHIIDWQNYCAFYKRREYERENFQHSMEYALKLMVKKGLIECDDIDEVIKKIDFREPPQILVACGLIDESPMKFSRDLRRLIEKKFKSVWQAWDTEMIMGNANPEILLKKGEPLNRYIENEIDLSERRKDEFAKELSEIAKMMYPNGMSKKTQKQFERELALLDRENVLDTLKILYALLTKIKKHEYPMIYDGYMSDSLIAYLLGLSEIDPTEYSFKENKEKTARLFIPVELRRDIIDYARSLYGKALKIEEECDHREKGIVTVYHLRFDYTNTPIDLVVPKFPYQTILYDLSRKICEPALYTYDDEVTLEYLRDEYGIKRIDITLKKLLKTNFSFLEEIHSQKTRVSLLYKLTFYNLLYVQDYYKTVLTYVLPHYTDLDSLVDELENSTIDRSDTENHILYDMYGDGFYISKDSAGKVYLTGEGYKEEISTCDMKDLYPYFLEEETR